MAVAQKDPAPKGTVSAVTGAPDPLAGWSREVVTLHDAVVYPPEISALVQPCGVVDSAGVFCAHSATWRGHRAMMTAPESGAKPAARLAGRHLWAGQIWAHFGHFMVESLARLWAYDDTRPDSIVFVPKRPKAGTELHGYQKAFLDLLGIGVPVTILTEPTEIEELVVPGQGLGLGPIDRGTPQIHAMFHQRFAPDVKPAGAKRIYLSRTALGGQEGGAILESLLEKNLAADGYEILHPQKLSLPEQIAQYRAASHVIGLDGSAFHLFGFVANKSQNAAVILRRNSSVFNGLKNQIEAFSGRTPDVVSAVISDWIPDKHNRPGRYSFGQLDFEKVAQELQAMGYISNAESWEIPSWRDVRRTIDAIGAGKKMTFVRRVKPDRTRKKPA